MDGWERFVSTLKEFDRRGWWPDAGPFFDDVMQLVVILIASTLEALIKGPDKHTDLQIPIFSEVSICAAFTWHTVAVMQLRRWAISNYTCTWILFLLVHIFPYYLSIDSWDYLLSIFISCWIISPVWSTRIVPIDADGRKTIHVRH